MSSKPVSINFFGSISAKLGEQPLAQLGSLKAQGLIIYLMLNGEKEHSREALMTLLWPETTVEKAQANLRQTLLRIRNTLPASDGHPLIMSERKTVFLNPQAQYKVDVLTF